MFLDRRRGKIVEGFGKFAAALREENSGGITFIGRLQSSGHGFLKMVLFGELSGSSFAFRGVGLNLVAFVVADFLARVEHQKRRTVLATQTLFKIAHPTPPSSWPGSPFGAE